MLFAHSKTKGAFKNSLKKRVLQREFRGGVKSKLF